MEAIISCGVLLAFVLLLAPLILLALQARRLRALEAAVRRLNARLGAEPIAPAPAPVAAPAAAARPAAVPVPPVRPPAPPPPAKPPRAPRPPIDWEAFMGVKLFAWVGGFALFLGVVFLVKYSFENNLITPAMRVLLGAIIGLLLVSAGWWTARRSYRVPGQSLCATGVLVLYAAVFGAHSYYDLVSLGTAFALMSFVTLAAFFLAVQMDAPVVVVLGLAGGFLTPLLLTTAEEPLQIFSYAALLNAGIAAVALRKRWDYLLVLAALGTILLELAWLPILNQPRLSAGFPIFLGLQAQFLGIAWLRQRLTPNERWSTIAAAATGFASLAFALLLLYAPAFAQRPGFFFSFCFLADAGLLTLAMWRPNPARLAGPEGVAVFAIFAIWTSRYLQHELLWWALGAYLLFALLHAGFSAWPPRPVGGSAAAERQPYVPLLALGLLLLGVWHGEAGFAVWVVIFLINLLALWLAALARSIVALLLALLLTAGTAALWILTAPPLEVSVAGFTGIIAGCGVFFSLAATFLARRLGLPAQSRQRHVPALAAALPFVLLLMVIGKLDLPDPTLVYAVALLMAVLLLGLSIVARTGWLAFVALVFTWSVEWTWQSLHFTNASALLALSWPVVFLLVFVGYAFFAAEERSLPWAVSALAGLLHFPLVFAVVTSAYPRWRNGLLPALFILPYAFGLWHLLVRRGAKASSGDARLAWQGGAALLFLSLIFPIQFEREWITLGWALEGLALLLLFRRVPNEGLRVVGAGMLCLAFIRLALNPAVFSYHRRTPVRIWNWYLYAYGVTVACLFLGGRAARGGKATRGAQLIPGLLYTLGTILAFLLLNIEIADYFSIGPTLKFSFSGNFARDMTYSIAWALFAFGLLLVGMQKGLRFVRYAGLALLLATLTKLFLHDLGNLSQLYRIGAFIGVALILILASFFYQRFLAPGLKPEKRP